MTRMVQGPRLLQEENIFVAWRFGKVKKTDKPTHTISKSFFWWELRQKKLRKQAPCAKTRQNYFNTSSAIGHHDFGRVRIFPRQNHLSKTNRWIVLLISASYMEKESEKSSSTANSDQCSSSVVSLLLLSLSSSETQALRSTGPWWTQTSVCRWPWRTQWPPPSATPHLSRVPRHILPIFGNRKRPLRGLPEIVRERGWWVWEEELHRRAGERMCRVLGVCQWMCKTMSRTMWTVKSKRVLLSRTCHRQLRLIRDKVRFFLLSAIHHLHFLLPSVQRKGRNFVFIPTLSLVRMWCQWRLS